MNNAKHSFWGRPAVAALILAGALAGASFSGTAEDGGQAAANETTAAGEHDSRAWLTGG